MNENTVLNLKFNHVILRLDFQNETNDLYLNVV